MKLIKRYLFLLHRWFGIALCLLFLLWFASGIVMMYVPYPELTEQEKLEALPPLQPRAIQSSLAQAMEHLPPGALLSELTISSVLGRPVFQLRSTTGERATVFADDGSRFAGLDPQRAEAAAAYFLPGSSPRYDSRIHMDQWTVPGGLNPLRPLHKVRLDDAAGTVVYISDVSGQIVRDTSFWERSWNWLGSTIHWIYPMALRRHPGLWADVVIYLSLGGMLVLITGTIIGLQRMRLKRRYRDDRITPYRGWGKWHHVLGLLSTVFISTFMFSGLLSMNPWGVFDNETSARTQIERYTTGSIEPGANHVNEGAAQAILDALASLDAATLQGVKELEWAQLDGETYFIAKKSERERELLFAEGPVNAEQLTARIERALPRLLPHMDIASLQVLGDYDNYYYSRHGRYRPLPVYRVKFADETATWFHIDASTGKVLNRLTGTDRVQRWLYNGLHSLDFRFLMERRPLWDVVVIFLSIPGLVFSATSLVLAWRRTLTYQRHLLRKREMAGDPVLRS